MKFKGEEFASYFSHSEWEWALTFGWSRLSCVGISQDNQLWLESSFKGEDLLLGSDREKL